MTVSAKTIRRCPLCDGTSIYEMVWRGANEPGWEAYIYTADEPYWCEDCDETFRRPAYEEVLEAAR